MLPPCASHAGTVAPRRWGHWFGCCGWPRSLRSAGRRLGKRGCGSPGRLPRYRTDHPYVGATRTRWAPLRDFVPEDGWGLQEARITVSAEPYHTLFFGFVADERRILSVVQRGNVFGLHSDSHERETVPAVWQPRTNQAAVS